METQWQPFENASLPPANKSVLVFTPETRPRIQIARWTGQGIDLLVVREREGDTLDASARRT